MNPRLSCCVESFGGASMGSFIDSQPTCGHPEKLPVTVFKTGQSDAPDRFEAWRQSIGVIFEVEPLERLSRGFDASVRTYNLGELLVSGTYFGDQQFTRNARKISADGLDHYLVQLYYEGGLVGSTRHNQMKVRPGDIQVVDLAQPHVSSAQNSSTIVLTVRRDILSEMLPDRADPHGVILAGDRGAGALLADYIKSLYSRLESVEAREAPFIARATVHMIAACLQPSAYTADRARVAIDGVIAERIKRHIDDNLASRDLSPASICRRFRISRTQLYRIFEPVGGVANHIQARRLGRAFALLRNPLYRHRRVFEVAFNSGFSSMAHFSVAFRKQFGLTPSEVREGIDAAGSLESGGARSGRRVTEGYEDWIRGLGNTRF